MRCRATVRMGVACLLLWPVGCLAPAPASTVLAPLNQAAARESRFPSQIDDLQRVSWEIEERSITGHYADASGDVTAWVTRFVCDPDEQDPVAYTSPRSLIAGLRRAGLVVKAEEGSTLRWHGRDFSVMDFRSSESGGVRAGYMLAGIDGPHADKYHVVIARVDSPEGSPRPVPLDVLEAILP